MKDKKYVKWLAGVMAFVTMAGTVQFPAADVQAGGNQNTSYEGEQNALSEEEYKEYGFDLSSPDEFDPENTDNPLEGYEPFVPTELYVGDMGRSSDWTGSFNVYDNAEEMGNSGLDITKMSKAWTETSFPYSGQGKDDREVQTHNSCGIDMDGDGTDEILDTTLLVNKTFSDNPKKRSQVEIRVYDETDGKVNQIAIQTYDLVNSSSDDKEFVWSIEADGSKGLVSLTAGDYDGDGKEEAAVYVPSTISDKPYVIVYDVENGSLQEKQKIYLSDISSNYSFHYKDWKLPIVSLATTQISGQDDLVIMVSLPLKDGDDYKNKKQESSLVIYGKNGDAASLSQKFIDTSMKGSSSSNRFRFCSAVDTDMNGNGVKELLVGGYKNEGYSSDDKVGSISESKNLIRMICWNTSQNSYEWAWDNAKEVEALSGLKVDYEMLEPVAMTSGVYFRGSEKTGVFLEGVLFNFSGESDDEFTEKELFSVGNFVKKATASLGGSHSAFISQAVSGGFSDADAGLEQICILSGDHASANNDYIYYDISWMWDKGGSIKSAVSNNDYINHKQEDDNGTFISIAAVNVDEDTSWVKYNGKEYGWSTPELYAVLESAPYWEELPYNSETYGAGKTTIEFTVGSGVGKEQEWNIGGGLFAEASLVAGASIFGNEVEVGGGGGGSAIAKYVSGWGEEHTQTKSISFQVAAGEDYTLLTVVPEVIYYYSVWIPDMEVTQELLDEYQDQGIECPYKLGDVIPAHEEDMPVSQILTPSFVTLPLEEYNALAESQGEATGLKVIDEDKLTHKTIGDPSTYPESTDEYKVLNAENLEKSDTAASVVVGEGETEFSYEMEKENEDEQGVDFDIEFELYAKLDQEVSLVGGYKFEAEVGAKAAGGYGETYVTTNSKGLKVSGSVIQLPSGADSLYQYQANFICYQAPWLKSSDSGAGGPIVVSYMVPNKDETNSPPSLPENLRVYKTTEHEVFLKWDQSDYRKAESYDFYIKDNVGQTQKIGSADCETGYFVAENLDAGTQYEFYAVAKAGKTSSYMSRSVAAYTKSTGDTPVFIQQPKTHIGNLGEEAEFSTEAQTTEGYTDLTYQWQKFSLAPRTGVGTWEDIEGATGASYSVTPDETFVEENGSVVFYRVVASQRKGANIKSAISDAAALYIGGQQTYIEPEVSLAVTAGNGIEASDGYYVNSAGTMTLSATVSAETEQGKALSGKVSFLAVDESKNQFQQWESTELKKQGDGTYTATLSDATAPKKQGKYEVYAIFEGTDGTEQVVYIPAISSPSRVYVGELGPDDNYYQINYHLNGGLNHPDNMTILTNESADLTLKDPAQEGAVFTGWYMDEALTQKVEVIDASELAADLDLYAGWEYIEYQIQYYVNMDGADNSMNPSVYTKKKQIVFKDPVKEGYDFEGWYTDEKLTNEITEIQQGTVGDVTVYGKWSHTHKYDENGFCVCGQYEPPSQETEGAYEISNAGELLWFAALVNGDTSYADDITKAEPDADAILTADIDLSGYAWTPIGNYNHKYTGTFDGNGKTISNMKIDVLDRDDVGFFGWLEGTAKDFTLTGEINVQNGKEHIGGVAGSMPEGTMKDVTSEVNIHITGASPHVGGVVGHFGWQGSGQALVEGCVYKGTIDPDQSGDCVGGVVGYLQYGTINGCVNLGTVRKEAEGDIYLGGILGYVNISVGNVTNCYNAGTIYGKTDTYCGAVIGYVRKIGKEDNNYYLDNMERGIGSGKDQTTSLTQEQFASGEAAWLLNGKKTDGSQIFFQKLGEQDYPLTDPSFGTVYQIQTKECPGAEAKTAYSNTEEDQIGEHDFVDGRCTICGQEENPPFEKDDQGRYEISTFEDLKTLKEKIASDTFHDIYEGADYVLTENIFVPADQSWSDGIGTTEYPFTGHFDGAGYIINGLKFGAEDNGEQQVGGLFSYIGEKGIVEDLHLTAIDSAGSFVTQGAVAAVNQGTIRQCVVGIRSNDGTVTLEGTEYDLSILKAFIEASEAAGGIAGINEGTIQSCRVSATVISNEAAGGIAGVNHGSILDCTNGGSVGNSATQISGGLVGTNTGTISNSFNTEPVQAQTEETKGSLVGMNEGTIQQCYYVEDTGAANGSSSTGTIDVQSMTAEDMKKDAFTEVLNQNADGRCSWQIGSIINAGYPYVRMDYLKERIVSMAENMSMSGWMHPELQVVMERVESGETYNTLIQSAGEKAAVYTPKLYDGKGNTIIPEFWNGGELTYTVPNLSGSKQAVAYLLTYDGSVVKIQPEQVTESKIVFKTKEGFCPIAVLETQGQKGEQADGNGAVRTGDTNNWTVPALALVAAAAAIVWSVRRRRKKSK